MAGQEKHLPSNPDDPGSVHRSYCVRTGTNSQRLFSALHRTVMACAHSHTIHHTQTHTLVIINLKKKKTHVTRKQIQIPKWKCTSFCS